MIVAARSPLGAYLPVNYVRPLPNAGTRQNYVPSRSARRRRGLSGLGDVLQDAVNAYAAIGVHATCSNVHVGYPGTDGYTTQQCTVPGDPNYHDANLVVKMGPVGLQTELNEGAAGVAGGAPANPISLWKPSDVISTVGAPTVNIGAPVKVPTYNYVPSQWANPIQNVVGAPDTSSAPAPLPNGATKVPAPLTSSAPSGASWFTSSMFGGVPNWALLGGVGAALFFMGGRR